MQQLSLELLAPVPPGWLEANRFNVDAWPQYIADKRGKRWLVLSVGGTPYAHSKPVRFCCHKPPTVEYHYIKEEEAFFV